MLRILLLRIPTATTITTGVITQGSITNINTGRQDAIMIIIIMIGMTATTGVITGAQTVVTMTDITTVAVDTDPA